MNLIMNFDEIKRKNILFYHIRKTGGTSINYSFFSLVSHNPNEVYNQIRKSDSKSLQLDGIVFQGPNLSKLNEGGFTYGYSHFPYEDIVLKDDKLFEFTVFRDPLERIISHYKMLLRYKNIGVQKWWLANELDWLGNSFFDFFENLPKERKFNQLYTFNKQYNIKSALENVNRLDYYFFFENYNEGLEKLSYLLELNLNERNDKKSKSIFSLTPLEKIEYRKKLNIEYQFLNTLKRTNG